MCLSILALIFLLILSAKMSPSAKDEYLTTITPDKSVTNNQPIINNPAGNMHDLSEIEDMEEEFEENEQEVDDMPPPPPETQPTTDSDSYTKISEGKFADDLTENVINTSNHYQILVAIASPADQLSRRSLMRQKYFGIHNNLLPCMTANSDIYYRFWVYGGSENLSGDERRRYEAERMEYDDIVDMPEIKTFDQLAIVNWVSFQMVYSHHQNFLCLFC
jgi:hypothetical protein